MSNRYSLRTPSAPGAIVLIGVAALAGSAQAQTTSGNSEGGEAKAPLLEEITVTARRTNESLQSVPVSISVLDEKALVERNITGPNDLAQAVPGLSAFNSQYRNSTTFSIRGMGAAFGASAPGVIAYYAEVPDFSPFYYDLASVQVLKGPQGTLFGKNTTGGAILFTPQKPTDEFTGFVTGRVGNFSRTDAEFAVGGPIASDILTFRVAGQVLRRNGFTHNLRSNDSDRYGFPDGKDFDEENRQSFRASLVYKPFEGFENYTLFQYDAINENGVGKVFTGFLDQSTTPHLEELRAYLVRQDELGPRHIDHDGPAYLEYLQRGWINTTTWSLPGAAENFTLKNTFRYSKGGEIRAANDNDATPYLVQHSIIPFEDPDFRRSNEFQVQYDGHNGITAVAGFFYDNNDDGSLLLDAALEAAPGVPLDLLITQRTGDSSKAGFIHGTWAFAPDWSLAMGWRTTHDKRTSYSLQEASVFFGPAVPLTLNEQSGKFHGNSFSSSINYNFSSDAMAYLSFRKGYKTGGFSGFAEEGREKYDPEYVTDFELGLKSQWTAGDFAVRLNTDVFYDKYRDIQRGVLPPAPPGQAAPIVIANAAKGDIGGLDIDLTLVGWDFLDASIQYTYLKTNYDDYTDPTFGDLSDSKFPNTPKHQLGFTVGVHHNLPGEWGSLSAQLPLFYQSEIALDVNNTANGVLENDRAIPGSLKPSWTRLDFRLDWTNILGKPLRAGFYVRNLTDKEYEVGGFNYLTNTQFGTNMTLYAAPRMTTFEMRYDF